jgi:hypothetical protein
MSEREHEAGEIAIAVIVAVLAMALLIKVVAGG